MKGDDKFVIIFLVKHLENVLLIFFSQINQQKLSSNIFQNYAKLDSVDRGSYLILRQFD